MEKKNTKKSSNGKQQSSKAKQVKSFWQKLDKRTRNIIALVVVALVLVGVIYAMGGGISLEYGEDGPTLVINPDRSNPVVADPASTPAANSPGNAAAVEGVLQAFILDIDQGDSIFLIGPTGKTMLVDAGENQFYDRIEAFLTARGITKIDVVIGTHPHADHIGAMRKVVNNFEIGAYYMPDVTTNTSTFENLLLALEKRDVPVYPAIAGADAFIEWEEQVEIRILSPFEGENYKDLNDWSVICRVRFGDTSIMLTGDAEGPAEKVALRELPASYFKSTILKMGHHGSSSSTTAAFFEAVSPEAAVISLGADNSYGHPHREIVALLKDAGIPYYRTDTQGTLHITLDGTNYKIETEK